MSYRWIEIWGCYLCYERGGERCERTNSNFLYRKLFTPDLNVFSFMQKLLFYPSHPSHLSPVAKNVICKYAICASQTIHLDCVNKSFRLQKQYVCECQIMSFYIWKYKKHGNFFTFENIKMCKYLQFQM